MEQKSFFKKKFPSVWQATFAVTAMIVIMNVVARIYALLTKIIFNPLQISKYGDTMLSVVLTELIVMLPIAFLFLYFSKCDILSSVRLRKGINPLQILLLVCLGLSALYFANGINTLFLQLLSSLGYTQLENMVPSPINSTQLVAGVLVIAVLPAFCEEFMFRGLVMRSFERYSPLVAALLSALLFGVMHGTWEQVLFAFILGLVLSYVVLITDSLWAAFVIHFLNNSFSVIVSFFVKPNTSTANDLLNGSNLIFACIVWIVLGIIGLGIFLPLFTLYTRRRNKIKYGAPLPVELVLKPIVAPVKHMFPQYLPLFIFFGLQLLQMILIWTNPEQFSGK